MAADLKYSVLKIGFLKKLPPGSCFSLRRIILRPQAGKGLRQGRGSQDFLSRRNPHSTRRPGKRTLWKKPEDERLIATLIVIGIGISIEAAVMISSGAGGLNIHINKLRIISH
jgi:hypothetical protein